jgi:hypothetical protein
VIFQWKQGSRYSIDPQATGERLEALTEANNGCITPRVVWQDAQAEDSPMHDAFTWDDEEAARKHRDNEARQLIRSIRTVVQHEDGTERPSYGYFHVELEDVGPAYVTSARALTDDELHAQVVADALAIGAAWARRYEGIEELAGAFRAIQRAEERAQRRQRGRQPRQRRVARP